MTSGAGPGVLRLTVGSFEVTKDSGKSGAQAFAQVNYGKMVAKTKRTKRNGKAWGWNETFAIDVTPASPATVTVQVWATGLVGKSQVGSVEICIAETTSVESQELCKKILTKDGKEQGDLRLRLQFEEGARASAGTSTSSQFLTSTSAGEGAITEATLGDVVEVEEVDLYDDADGNDDNELAPLPERSHDRFRCAFNPDLDVGPLGAGLASFTAPTSPFANARGPSEDGDRASTSGMQDMASTSGMHDRASTSGTQDRASTSGMQPDTLRSKSVSHPPRTPVQLREHPAEDVLLQGAQNLGPRPGSFTAQAFMRAGMTCGSFTTQAALRTAPCTTSFTSPLPTRPGRPDLSIAQNMNMKSRAAECFGPPPEHPGGIPAKPCASPYSSFTAQQPRSVAGGGEGGYRHHSSPLPAHSDLTPSSSGLQPMHRIGNHCSYDLPSASSCSSSCRMPADAAFSAPSAPPLPDFAMVADSNYPAIVPAAPAFSHGPPPSLHHVRI